MILAGTAFYIFGEIKNKWGKYLMGFPIGIIDAIVLRSWIPLLCLATYFVACQIGYGEKNWLTKLVGIRAAITIHGCAVGLASFPIVGWWAIVGGIFSGLCFLGISFPDEAKIIREPWIAILRGLAGTAILLVGG